MTSAVQHYKVSQVAELLSVSNEQVHLLISDGRLPAIDVGRGAKKYWRVSQADLDAYIQTQRAKSYGGAKSA